MRYEYFIELYCSKHEIERNINNLSNLIDMYIKRQDELNNRRTKLYHKTEIKTQLNKEEQTQLETELRDNDDEIYSLGLAKQNLTGMPHGQGTINDVTFKAVNRLMCAFEQSISKFESLMEKQIEKETELTIALMELSDLELKLLKLKYQEQNIVASIYDQLCISKNKYYELEETIKNKIENIDI